MMFFSLLPKWKFLLAARSSPSWVGWRKLRNRRGHVAVGEVSRLNEGRPVQIGAVRIRRVPVGIQQRLAGNVTAAGRAAARHGLAATTDAEGSAALVAVDARNIPVAEEGVEHRMHVGAEGPALAERQIVHIAQREDVGTVVAADHLLGRCGCSSSDRLC